MLVIKNHVFEAVNFIFRMGNFTVELYWKHAPKTCRNFAELARRGYYNDTVFHRIIPDFMLQGGDPTGTGICICIHLDIFKNHLSESVKAITPITFLFVYLWFEGRGGESIYGKNFEDEIHSDLKHSGAGILSMANAGPNTNGSQFFITLAPTQWLDGKHAIFGRISDGLIVIQRIGKVPTDKNDKPLESVKIFKATVSS